MLIKSEKSIEMPQILKTSNFRIKLTRWVLFDKKIKINMGKNFLMAFLPLFKPLEPDLGTFFQHVIDIFDLYSFSFLSL